MAKRIPKEHEDAIISAYLGGASAAKAAAQFGYSEITCFNALKRKGMVPRSHAEACNIPSEHEEAIVAAYLAGATLAKAAALFGYSGNVCLNALRRRGITPRSHAEIFRIPQEHEDAITSAYLAGASLEEASALFGYTGNVCLHALRRRGITPRSHTEACSIPPEHEEGMITAYLSGVSTAQAAAPFGHTAQTCSNILKRRGITPRSHEEVCRRYAVDENFFDYIDTEEKAYWLGFITADGGIVKGAIVLQLKIDDIGHLYKFTTALHSDHPVSIREVRACGRTQPMGRVVISSVKLVQALLKLGVGEKKSHIVRPCEHIPGPLLNAYWRGVVDGDGSVCCEPTRKRWIVSLVGNQFIVTGFRDFIAQFVNSKAAVRPHKSIFIIRYSGNLVARAAAWILYSGATIYLDRKYASAKELYGNLL